jgi:hypothetical protein
MGRHFQTINRLQGMMSGFKNDITSDRVIYKQGNNLIEFCRKFKQTLKKSRVG